MKPRNGEETVPIDVKFERSVELVRSLPSDGPLQLSYASAAKVYSYFKQAKFGPCKDTKPNFWDVIKKAKWEAWTKLGNMPQETAMTLYVNEIKEHFKEFIKQADFDEDDCDFSETVVSYCSAVNLPCPKQLEKYSTKDNHDDHISTVISTNGESHAKVNGDHVSLANGKDTIAVLKDKACKEMDEASIKKVDFDEIKKESGDESGDDIYCDSIEPGEASDLFSSHLNGSSSEAEAIVNSSTPLECKNHVNDITSTDSIHLPNGDGPLNNRKDLKASKNNHGKTSKRGTSLPFRNAGIDRHRQPRRSSEKGTHRQHSERSPLPDASEDVECDSDAMADALRNFDSSGGSGKDPSDDTDSECSAVYSLTDDRILIALKRLQRDIHVVSERIAAIEYSMCRHKNHTGSWLDGNGPSSKTMLFFLVWPVLVNVLFFYWRSRRKQRPR